MINKPPPSKGLNIWIPAIIPMRGGGLFIRGLGYHCMWEGRCMSDRVMPAGATWPALVLASLLVRVALKESK